MILNVPTDMPPTQEGAIPKNEPESVRDKLYQIACDMAERYAKA